MYSWLELEQCFRRLRKELKAHCLETRWDAEGESWQLIGPTATPRSLAEEQFENLTYIAGRRFLRVFTPEIEDEKPYFYIHDGRLRWYKALQLRSPAFQAGPDGQSGKIAQITEASADLCLLLHGTHPHHLKTTPKEWIRKHYFQAALIVVLVSLVCVVGKWAYGL